ncbi:hypothetical protein J4429_05260 [Candidatus Pacearchaeota archaeon]|nr:hypothetical protein [Candidatus Pacearchaeota archaeon]
MINQKALKKQLDEIGDSVLKSMVLATLKAGNKITKKEYNDELMEKGEHHFIVTSADFISQKIILKKLSADFPSAYFITEEKEKDKKLRNKTLNSENFKEYVYKKENYIFGIDSLDGTSQYKNGLYEWSVSIGEMFERNERGSIYAPEIKGGLLAFGGAGNGVYLAEGKNKIQKAYVAKDKEDKNSLIYYGVDIPLYSNYNRFVNEIANFSRTINICGSCALGLALVACGKIDAFIQPTQAIWDWFAGYPLVENAGGKIQFYRFKGENILLIDKPDLEDYNPEKKNLGFIAGNKKLVGRLIEKLINLYNK